jgi:glycosyltransferase involved in cell wall biosynthesis
MKFLAIGHLPPRRYAGGLLTALSLGKLLKASGHQIDFVTTHPSAVGLHDSLIEGFQFQAFPIAHTMNPIIQLAQEASLVTLYPKLRNLRSWLRDRIDKYDALVALSVEYWSNAPVLWLKLDLGKPMIVHDLPDNIAKLKHPFYARHLRTVLKNADGVITLSSAQAEYVNTLVRKPKDKVVVIPNWIDLSKFHPKVSGARARSKYGINEKDFVILTFGRATKFANVVQKSLSALSNLREHIGNLRLLSVANTSVGWTKMISKYHLNANCIDVPYLSHDLVPETIAAADACLLCYPSHYIVTPQRLFEFMAMGKAVLTPPYPGIKGVLDSTNSLIVGYEDLEKNYQDGILRVYEDKEMRMELQDRVRKRAEDLLELPTLSGRIQGFISNLFG